MRFEKLEVWQRSVELSVEVYEHFAGHRDFGFRDQITRSSLSLPSNIAEGYERHSDREKALFLNYAKGSAGELRTQVHIGSRIGYIPEDVGSRWIDEVEQLSRMLFAIIRTMQ
ncbi:four helix bundle protein [Alcanivorax sp. DSM 26293]|jgi:four helix bundle protein|uniref:four helix bundle protein n=1 Tax=unclassified Alcanivorax TaxID=2638842 RepID=UPI00089FDB8D|nr:four helix bundle protein [Alcanivorax sp. DSM 26293]SEF39890.1 four helix bundle protein [Alcanivorax sp. DSM 26293]